MHELTLMIGVIMACVLILLLAYILDKEHVYLKFILLFAMVFLLLLIPKSALDEEQNCEKVLNRTVIQSSALNPNKTITNTTYYYTELCDSVSVHKTSTIFYVSMTWLVRVIVVYVFIYLSYYALKKFEVIK